jgi:PAS domain S-box-containing protein
MSRLITQFRKKTRYEDIIINVSNSIHQSIDLEEVLESAVGVMHKNIDGVDNISIYFIEGNEAVIKAYRGYTQRFIDRVGRIPYPRGFTWKTIIAGKPRYVANADNDDVIGPAGREIGTKSYLSMPIHFKNEVVGCININSLKYNAFDNEELKLLEVVTSQIEMAINNAKLADEIRENHRFLDALINNFPSVAFRTRFDEKLKTIYVNNSILDLTGYRPSDFVENRIVSYHELIHPDDREHVLSEIKTAMKAKGLYDLSYRIITKDGEIKWVWEKGRGIFSDKGDLLYLESFARDISKLKRTELELIKTKDELERRVTERTKNLSQINEKLVREISKRERIEKELEDRDQWLRLAISSANIATYDWDIMSDNARCSSLFYALFGLDPKTVKVSKADWLNCIHSDDRVRVVDALNKSLDMREPFNVEYRVVWPDESVHWLSNRSKVFYNDNGEPYRIAGAVIDITARKEFEQQIEAALKEKEILLNEVHHRVKNNLQIISSLLNLKSGYLTNLEARESIIESRNRVKIMSIIHEHLYKSGDLVRINYSKFIKTLMQQILNFYSLESNKTKLKLDIDEIKLNVDKAIPCSLIINELISNSFKHGFTRDGSGEVSLRFKSVESNAKGTAQKGSAEKKLLLIVHNTGRKFPDDIDFRNSKSLGLQLVCALTKQLKGEISLDTSNGTEFQIIFPYETLGVIHEKD